LRYMQPRIIGNHSDEKVTPGVVVEGQSMGGARQKVVLFGGEDGAYRLRERQRWDKKGGLAWKRTRATKDPWKHRKKTGKKSRKNAGDRATGHFARKGYSTH